jgi:hypothetical protein
MNKKSIPSAAKINNLDTEIKDVDAVRLAVALVVAARGDVAGGWHLRLPPEWRSPLRIEGPVS